MLAKQLSWPFSPARVALIARNRLLEELVPFGIVIGLIVGVNILSLVFFDIAVFNHFDGNVWATAFGLAGAFLASGAFRAMHKGKSGCDWLLTPATACEQYTAAFIVCFVAFPLVAFGSGVALSALFSAMEIAAGGSGGNVWQPFKTMGFMDFAGFLVSISVLFAGSARFRKLPMLKTIGVSVGFYVLVSIILMVVLNLFLNDYVNSSSFDLSFMLGRSEFSGEDRVEKGLKAVKLLYNCFAYGLVPLFSIFYGYFCVNEKEARDEVQ